MKYIPVILFACFFVIACQKSITGPATPPAATVKCTGCSYLPVCDSTKLTYVDSSAAGADTTASTLFILGDTTINGTKYNRVTPFATFSQGLLYNCDGGNYKTYQPVPSLGLNVDSLVQTLGLPIPVGTIPIPTHIETYILKSGLPAGATWSDTVFKFSPLPFVSIVAKLDYKIEEKGVQRTVLGKVYNDVIHVSSKLNLAIPMVPAPASVSVDYYFANNIGIIETKVTNAGQLQAQAKLLSYKIK